VWLGTDSAFRGNATKSIGKPLMLASSAFAGQNPITHSDPDGRDFLWKVNRTTFRYV
jgi:hypothetical protein